MYKSNALLVEPADETLLWRYMDFTKFLALLENRSLHMSPLASFNDPFEAHPPRSFVDAFVTLQEVPPFEELAEFRKDMELSLRVYQNMGRLISASCWHANPSESAAMWAQYLRAGEGLAVQTTFSRLKHACAASPILVWGSMVEYVDFDTFSYPNGNILTWATLKRNSFEHEREFRLLSFHHPGEGFPLQVDLGALIEAVYVAPTTPTWITELVRKLLSHYAVEAELNRSRLQDAPGYYQLPDWARGP